MQTETSFLVFPSSDNTNEPKPLGLLSENNGNTEFKFNKCRLSFSSRRLFDDIDDDSDSNNKENIPPIAINTDLADVPDLQFTDSPVFFSRKLDNKNDHKPPPHFINNHHSKLFRGVTESVSCFPTPEFKPFKRSLPDNSNYLISSFKRNISRSYSLSCQSLNDFSNVPSTPSSSIASSILPDELILPNTKEEGVNYINCETMSDILDDTYSECYSKIYILDARFPYEYNKGHIKGAINFINPCDIETFFFSEEMLQDTKNGNKVLVIFYCEFSVLRSVNMARYLRKCDRKHNSDNYPYLDYNEVYVLKGGYRNFNQEKSDYCNPSLYVSMKDDVYRSEMKSCCNELTRSWRSLGEHITIQ